jgi:hypothetical protein
MKINEKNNKSVKKKMPDKVTNTTRKRQYRRITLAYLKPPTPSKITPKCETRKENKNLNIDENRFPDNVDLFFRMFHLKEIKIRLV